MAGLYRLFNMESLRMLKVAGIIGVLLIIANGLFIRSELKHLHEYTVIPRFEDVYSAAGGTVLFWAGLIAVLIWFAVSFYAHYWGSKSIYTLLTLPVSRRALHIAKLTSLLCSILLLLCAQFISILYTYRLYEAHIASFEESFIIANGLFLAFIRSGFFRLVFPLTLEGVLHGVVIWSSIATMLFYTILLERSQKFGRSFIGGIIPIQAAVYCLINLIQLRLADPVRLPYESMTTDTVYSVILVLLSGYFIWHSLRWMQKGAIA